ncbi:MAG: hypothetical protein JHD16_09825 [Solirubrobacteraceae bacterium]|nr:hypothetical protein [Solirubrobacteraceae bacterium]
MRRRFLPLAAAFSMMAAAVEEQQSASPRDTAGTPNGETFDREHADAQAAAPAVASREQVPRPGGASST